MRTPPAARPGAAPQEPIRYQAEYSAQRRPGEPLRCPHRHHSADTAERCARRRNADALATRRPPAWSVVEE
jgi:hypothetical protein